jgi:hypothetical protein
MLGTDHEWVNIPLPLQEVILDAFLLDEPAVVVASFITRHWDEIVAAARERHADGFHVYGSTAYGWSIEERTDNAIEEVADLLVYLSTGEVE